MKASLFLVLLGSTGCSFDANHGDTLQEPSTDIPGLPSGRDEVPKHFVDNDGREWLVRTVTPGVSQNIAAAHRGPTSAELDSMSDDDLARTALMTRVVPNADGTITEYEQIFHPVLDTARVRQARASRTNRMRVGPDRRVIESHQTPNGVVETAEPIPIKRLAFEVSRSKRLLPELNAEKPIALGPLLELPPPQINIAPSESKHVFWGPGTSGGRVWTRIDDRTVWPNAAQGYTPICSFTMIGYYTAISAAHCFYARANSTFISTALPLYTGHFDYNIGATRYVDNWLGPYSTCLSIWVPSAWKVSGNDSDDFAVIDFASCGAWPGSPTWGGQYVAPAYGTLNDYPTASQARMIGYDGDYINEPSPSQPTNPNGRVYNFRSEVGRTLGAAQVGLDYTYRYSMNHYLDTTKGSSGACIMLKLFSSVGDPTLYCTGANTSDPGLGVPNNHYFSSNTGRVMDQWVWLNWVKPNSTEYR